MRKYEINEVTLNGKTHYLIVSSVLTFSLEDDVIYFKFKNGSTVLGGFMVPISVHNKLNIARSKPVLIREQDKQVFYWIEKVKHDFYCYLSRDYEEYYEEF